MFKRDKSIIRVKARGCDVSLAYACCWKAHKGDRVRVDVVGRSKVGVVVGFGRKGYSGPLKQAEPPRPSDIPGAIQSAIGLWRYPNGYCSHKATERCGFGCPVPQEDDDPRLAREAPMAWDAHDEWFKRYRRYYFDGTYSTETFIAQIERIGEPEPARPPSGRELIPAGTPCDANGRPLADVGAVGCANCERLTDATGAPFRVCSNPGGVAQCYSAMLLDALDKAKLERLKSYKSLHAALKEAKS